MGTKIITVRSDFSRFPAGRFRTDGSWSGQKFREELLVPAVKGFDKVVVQLDGTLGFGSSFLEEAFGGLVRKERFTIADLKKKLELRASDKSLVSEIWGYMDEA